MVYLSLDSTIRVKANPGNYFQATSRKPNISVSWLIAVLNVWVVSAAVLLSAPFYSAPECLLRM